MHDDAPMHAAPQSPQLLLLFASFKSTHVPPQHERPGTQMSLQCVSLGTVPAHDAPSAAIAESGHAHAPDSQSFPLVQACAHAPQFVCEEETSTHELPQHVDAAPVQTVPHAPQSAALDVKSTHVPPQHAAAGLVQTVPHAPQFPGSDVRFLQPADPAEHCVAPGGHPPHADDSGMHTPAQHRSWRSHLVAHAPQWSWSRASSTQPARAEHMVAAGDAHAQSSIESPPATLAAPRGQCVFPGAPRRQRPTPPPLPFSSSSSSPSSSSSSSWWSGVRAGAYAPPGQ